MKRFCNTCNVYVSGAMQEHKEGKRHLRKQHPETSDKNVSLVTQRVFYPHSDWVYCCCVSPNGLYVASGCKDTKVRIWKIADGSVLHTLTAHTESVLTCCYSSDGTLLASGGQDYRVCLWDAVSGTLRWEMSCKSRVQSCVFRNGNSGLVTGCKNGSVYVWSIDFARSFLTMHAAAGILHCSMSPNGKLLACGLDNGTVQVMSLNDRTIICNLFASGQKIYGCCFSPDNEWLAAGSSDSSVRLWNTTTWEIGMTFCKHSGTITSCSFSSEGNAIASSSMDGTIKIWNITNGKSIKIQSHNGQVFSCDFSSPGILVSVGNDNKLKIWKINMCLTSKTEPNLEKKNLIQAENLQYDQPSCILSAHTDWVLCCCVSPDGMYLASGSKDTTVRIWNIVASSCRHVLRLHTASVVTCCYSKDGKLLASGGSDSKVCLWDPIQGILLWKVVCSGLVQSCVFCPGTNDLISGCKDGSISICSTSGQRHLTFKAASSIYSCSVYPNGLILACALGNGNVELISLISEILICTLSGHGNTVYGCCFSPDGKWLATTSSDDASVKLWQTSTWKIRFSFSEATTGTTSCCFSSDSSQIAAGSMDGSIKIWSVIDGTFRKILSPGQVFSCSFSPCGLLASVGDDKKVKLWNLNKVCKPALKSSALIPKDSSPALFKDPFSPKKNKTNKATLSSKRVCDKLTLNSAGIWRDTFAPTPNDEFRVKLDPRVRSFSAISSHQFAQHPDPGIQIPPTDMHFLDALMSDETKSPQEEETKIFRASFWNLIIFSRYWIFRVLKMCINPESLHYHIKRFIQIRKDTFEKFNEKENEAEEEDVKLNVQGKTTEEGKLKANKNNNSYYELKNCSGEWYLLGKELLIRIVENNDAAIQFSKYLSTQFDPEWHFIGDIIKWIRSGRQIKKELVFSRGPIGFLYEGNVINAVRCGSLAAQVGVGIGWKMFSICGERVPCDSMVIDSILSKAYLKLDPINIVFLIQGSAVPASADNTYAPIQNAVLELLVFTRLSDFLDSQFWFTAQIEMQKIKFYHRWRVLEENVPIYPRRDSSSKKLGTLKRGHLIDGKKYDDWIHHSKGWSKLEERDKTLIIQCRRKTKPIVITPLPVIDARMMKESYDLINVNINKNNWLSRMKKLSQILPVAIIIVDITLLDHPVIFVNQKFTEVTGYTASYAIGRNCRYLQGKYANSPNNLIQRKILKDSILNGKECLVNFHNFTRCGRSFHNLLAVKPIFKPTTQVVQYALGVLFDVSAAIDRNSISPDLMISHTMQFINKIS